MSDWFPAVVVYVPYRLGPTWKLISRLWIGGVDKQSPAFHGNRSGFRIEASDPETGSLVMECGKTALAVLGRRIADCKDGKFVGQAILVVSRIRQTRVGTVRTGALPVRQP